MTSASSQTENQKPNGTGITRVIKAASCSFKGLKAAFVHEAAFRQELLLVLCLMPIAFFTSESLTRFMALVSVLILVLIVELLNSAIEATVDRISLDHHILAGRAKDMGSAAVALSLLTAAIVWIGHIYLLIFTP
ncbi:diacylglycerol kinase [Catenovulum maritimum]|uniref:Diacylglycerol kinase n=1 Tax=Catenovulum maritimum TaxID=1513271 RepID=A0A0J8GXD9_9ALTE|nr:diacylglycerol kinase [Catenovulum maritimum]KMT65914.1 diacylglycerol kinase [Catenovulum maritimum]